MESDLDHVITVFLISGCNAGQPRAGPACRIEVEHSANGGATSRDMNSAKEFMPADAHNTTASGGH